MVLGPTRVLNANDISIASAVFAGLASVLWRYGGLKPQDFEKVSKFLQFWVKDPYRKIFKILYPKDSPHRLMCSIEISWNLVDGKSVQSCVIYVRKTFRLALRYCGDRTQNLPGPASDNVLQISSKSVNFLRSYIRMREHRPSALQSECNIRQKPSFEPNQKYIHTHKNKSRKCRTGTCQRIIKAYKPPIPHVTKTKRHAVTSNQLEMRRRPQL